MDWQNAIFAPGWVWSLASMVLVGGSLIGLYRELRVQADINARQQLESFSREWESERLMRAQRDVMVMVRAGVPLEELQGASAMMVARFWEKVGAVCRAGHANPKLLLEAVNGNEAPLWWAGIGPSTRKYREERNAPSTDEHFEWLADRISSLMAQAGDSVDFGPSWSGSRLDGRLAAVTEMLTIEREIRSSEPIHEDHKPATRRSRAKVPNS